MEQKAMQSERETYRRQRKNKKSKVEVLTEAQKIAFAPMTFQALAALVDFNILQTISQTPLTREEVMQKCNLSKYTVYTLFDAALYAGLIKKDEQGAYSATDLGEAFLLDPMTKANFNFIKDVCYLGAHELKESFAKNTPVGLQKHHINSKTIYEVLPQLPEQMLKSWYEFDHYYSDDCFGEVLKIMFNPAPAKVFDIGGNTGKWALQCVHFDKEVEVTVLDLPQQIEMLKENIKEDKDAERIKGFAINLLDEQSFFPQREKGIDAIWMSQFLDCFAMDEIVRILSRAKKVMAENTRLYIMETLWDRQHYEPAAFCLTMTSLYFTAIANGNSKMYNTEDMRTCIESAGLAIERIYDGLGHGHSVLVCKINNV